MKYNQLTEAIIKVPNELLSKINMYVASFLSFKIGQTSKNIKMFVYNDEKAQQVQNDAKQTMAKLQTQYGAKNISAQTADTIFNKSIRIPFNVPQFFKELNYKNVSQELINKLEQETEIYLLITDDKNSTALGSNESYGGNKFLVTINVNRLGYEPSFFDTASDIMRTVYHELQHVVQSLAIKNINKNDKQLKKNKNYDRQDGDYLDYYSSGVEYTPQLGDYISKVNLYLEKLEISGKLGDNKNEIIRDAIISVAKDNRMFLISLYKNEPELYKKSLKAIYSYCSKKFDELKKNGVDYTFTDLPPEELDANINVLNTVYKLIKQSSYEINAKGRSYDNLQSVHIKARSWDMDISKQRVNKEKFYVNITSTDPEFHDMFNMNSNEVLNLASFIKSMRDCDASDIIDDIEYITGEIKETTAENIETLINDLDDDATNVGVAFKQTSKNSFSVFGLNFEIEPAPNTANKVNVNYGNNTLFVWTLKQVLIVFQMLIRYYPNEKDNVHKILNNCCMYMEFMTEIRKL